MAGALARCGNEWDTWIPKHKNSNITGKYVSIEGILGERMVRVVEGSSFRGGGLVDFVYLVSKFCDVCPGRTLLPMEMCLKFDGGLIMGEPIRIINVNLCCLIIK